MKMTARLGITAMFVATCGVMRSVAYTPGAKVQSPRRAQVRAQ